LVKIFSVAPTSTSVPKWKNAVCCDTRAACCIEWVTITTVGYGDHVPVTGAGKAVASMCMVCGLIVISLPITIISANFDEETREHNRRFEVGRRRTAQLERLA